MELKLYDTLTREKREFRPIDPARVRMYVCGPTVYDYAHIGNARPVIVFDVLFRLLRHLYGAEHVTYVRNITDVDDKINARAAERGISIRNLTEETYKNFKADVTALGCLPPTVEPRATEHIEEMKAIIERLVKGGHAYVAEGHVLFSVPSMNDYGRLSNRSLDEMIAGARVEVAPYKKDATDFVLWKPSKEGEPSWPSPCGIATPGRPGWHIECSAMSWKHLGEMFDIHGGGIDLVFPHHEDEIAQSRCAFHTPFMAKTWMHNGFLEVEGMKMSKSLGNFITIRNLLSGFVGDVLRYNMLKTHYTKPIDWRKSELERSRHDLWKLADIIPDMAVEEHFSAASEQLIDRSILEFLVDDLNTPVALMKFQQLGERAKRDRDTAKSFAATAYFMGFLHLNRQHYFTDSFVSSVPDEKISFHSSNLDSLTEFKNLSANGIFDVASTIASDLHDKGVIAKFSPEKGLSMAFADVQDDEPLEEKVERLITERNAARSKKDFKESDRIRDELAKMGVVLKDSKDGTTWEIAR
jgi:cysteinyl-tRNA synthetase